MVALLDLDIPLPFGVRVALKRPQYVKLLSVSQSPRGVFEE